MSIKIRKDAVDDKHHIRDPLENDSADDVSTWANTLKKTRIKELFLSLEGLKGHVQQLQNELNRTTPERLDGCSAPTVEAAYEANRALHKAIKKAMQAALFKLSGTLKLNIPLLKDAIVI